MESTVNIPSTGPISYDSFRRAISSANSVLVKSGKNPPISPHNCETSSQDIRTDYSCGSRISCWGAPTCWGGTNLRCIHFSAKMYVKMKELDPVGSASGAPLDLPMDYGCFDTYLVNKNYCTEPWLFPKKEMQTFVIS